MDRYGSSPPRTYGYPPQNQPYPPNSSPPKQQYSSHSLPPNQPYPSHSPPPYPPYPTHSPPPKQPYPSHSQTPNQPYPAHSLPHPNHQPYPPPPQNQPYQNQLYPPNSPPQNSDASSAPSPQAAFPYPFAVPYQFPHGQSAYQYPYPYPQPAYPSQHTRPYSFSGPLPQTSAPSPGLQHSISFHQQVSSHFQYPDAGIYPPPPTHSQPPSQANSFSGGLGHDNSSSGVSFDGEGNRPSNVSIFPPLDNQMADMRLNDNRPSAPASPPAPALSKLDCFALAYPGSSGNLPAPRMSKLDSFSVLYPSPSGSASPYGSHHGGHSRTSSWDGNSPYRIDTSISQRFPPYDSPAHMQLVPFHKGSLKVLLLHGNLDIWIYEAKNLPNMDLFHKTLGDVFCKLPGGVVSKIEGSVSRTITSDPYVSITVSNAVIGRTYVISNEENPVWMQHFNVPVAHNAAEVHFLVKDSDVVGSQLIGCVSIPVEQIYSGVKIEGTYPILNANGRQCKAGAVLSLSIQYIPIKNLSIYHYGVGAGPDYHGVLGTYFPLRRGGTVTLFQDAHVPDGWLPDITLDGGRKYVHGKCWRDIFDAIRQARRLIYITGWSVWHKVRLVRDNPASDCTLGELLRSKSAEGVRVLLLVWDDPTSRSILGYRTDGIMATHDEETRRYFKHSSVQVLLCPRVAGKRHSWYKQTEISTIYTHHQKTVVVDAEAGNNRRKIVAFVGGLDLCDGRYDTPEHPLFRTLQKEHLDDYHNPCLQGNTADCPREPWHDLHCKIDGPAAYDVLTNFQERWRRASKPHGIKKLKGNYDDALLIIERLPDIVGISEAPCLSEYDPESWHVQVFRSIDSSSVKGFPKNPKDATSRNLVCGKNVLIDMSIHTAYVKAIRSAQHYIYIENQYFIGSSFNWSQHKDLGADNLIPMEIALKIAEKIRNHERFGVYIVIPMWPEGIPNSTATQRILYWQNKTMQMMYETIYKALVEVGLEDSYTPQDYLNFFCLGNREVPDGSQAATGSSHQPNSPQALCIKSRRFMIYVHSKGMIVDDEYVILGSANINQRSMEGTRDTEIAMGAYQPHYTWARKRACPRGQVYGYRMSLWAEHLGLVDDCFNAPESLECVRKVRTLSEMNWTNFAAETPTVMLGHLLKYPVDVERRGKVKSLPGCENFPDLGGNICGSFNGITENLTI